MLCGPYWQALSGSSLLTQHTDELYFGDIFSLSNRWKKKGHWLSFTHQVRPWGTNKLCWPWPAFWGPPFMSPFLETPFWLSLGLLVPGRAMPKDSLSCAYAHALCIHTPTHGLTFQLDLGPGLVIMNLPGHHWTSSWAAHWLSSLTLDLPHQHKLAWWSGLLAEPGRDL